jgi:TPR repeat protein
MSVNRLLVAVGLAGLTAVVAVASVPLQSGQSRAQTPSRPDFSGKWVLEGSPSEGLYSPFGSRFTATQTKDDLTLEMVTVKTFDEGGPVTLTMAEPPVRRVIRFSAEERETYPPLPPVSSDPLFGMTAISFPVSSVTRTGWQGEHLVITSHTVSRTSAPGQTPPVFETRDLDQLAISLVGKSGLSVERLRVEDPVPWGQNQYFPPETSTVLYRREGSAPDLSAESMESPTVTALKHRADTGDAAAEAAMAERYATGNDVPMDTARSVSWYRKAAGQGNSFAQNALGRLYDYGIGVPKDPTRATSWYRKAADGGFVSAQLELGFRYEGAKGVAQDFRQAAFWFRKAANQGDATAQFYLASQYMASGPQSIGQDYAQAAFWYRKAADQGMPYAMSSLGDCYDRGQGIPQDRVEAFKWQILAQKMGAPTLLGTQERRAKSLTSQQVTEAQKRADVWLAEFQKRVRK